MCAHAVPARPPAPAPHPPPEPHPATLRLAPQPAVPQQHQQRAPSVASDTSSSESEMCSSEEELSSSSPCFEPYNKRAYWFFRNCRTVGVQTRAVRGRCWSAGAGAGAGSLRARTVTGDRVLIEPHDDTAAGAAENAPVLLPANLPLCVYELRNVVACTATNLASQLCSRLLSGTECCFLQLRKQLKYPVKSKPPIKERKKEQYTQFDFNIEEQSKLPFTASQFIVAVNSDQAYGVVEGGGSMRGGDGGGDGVNPQSPTTRPRTLRSRAPGAATTSPPAPGAATTSPPAPSAATTSPPAPGAATTSPPAPGAATTSPPAPGAATTSPPAPGAATTSPPAPGAATTSPPAPGAATTSPPAPGAATTSPPAPGAATTSSPAPGATTTSSPAPGAATTSPPAPGAATTSPPAPGAATTSPPAPGAATTSPPAPGAATTSPPAPGAATTSPPAPGAATTSPPAPGAATTSPPAPGAATTSPPAPSAATTSPPAPGATTTSSPAPGAATTSPPAPGAATTSSPAPGATTTSSPVVNSIAPPLPLPLKPCLCNSRNATDACKEHYTKINSAVNATNKLPLKEPAISTKVLKKKTRKPLWRRCFKCFRKDVLPCSCVGHMKECVECKSKRCICSNKKCKSCFNNSDPFLDPNFIKLLHDETNYHDALKSRNIFIITDKRKALKALPTRCGWRAEKKVKAPCTLCNPEPEHTPATPGSTNYEPVKSPSANRIIIPGKPGSTSSSEPVKSPCICKTPIETKVEITTGDQLVRPCKWISNTKDGKICSICKKQVCECQCESRGNNDAKSAKNKEKKSKLQTKKNNLSKDSKAGTKLIAAAKQAPRIQAEKKRIADVKQDSEINAENKPISKLKQGSKTHSNIKKEHLGPENIIKDQNDINTKEGDTNTFQKYTNAKKDNKNNNRTTLSETITKEKESNEKITISKVDENNTENNNQTKPFDGITEKENSVESASKQKILSGADANEQDISKEKHPHSNTKDDSKSSFNKRKNQNATTLKENSVNDSENEFKKYTNIANAKKGNKSNDRIRLSETKTKEKESSEKSTKSNEDENNTENNIKAKKPFDGKKVKENSVVGASKQKLLSGANANEQNKSKEKHPHSNTMDDSKGGINITKHQNATTLKENSVNDSKNEFQKYTNSANAKKESKINDIIRLSETKTQKKGSSEKISKSNEEENNTENNIKTKPFDGTKAKNSRVKSGSKQKISSGANANEKDISKEKHLHSITNDDSKGGMNTTEHQDSTTLKENSANDTKIEDKKDAVSKTKYRSRNMATKEDIIKLELGKCPRSNSTSIISTRKISKGSSNTTKCTDCNCESENSINSKNQLECVIKLISIKDYLKSKSSNPDLQNIDSKVNSKIIKFPIEKNKVDMSYLSKETLPNSAIRYEKTGHISVTDLKTRQVSSSIYKQKDDIDTVSIPTCQNGNKATKQYKNKSLTENNPNNNSIKEITKDSINKTKCSDCNHCGWENSISGKNQSERISAIKENFDNKSSGNGPESTAKKFNSITKFPGQQYKRDMNTLGKEENLNNAIRDGSKSKVSTKKILVTDVNISKEKKQHSTINDGSKGSISIVKEKENSVCDENSTENYIITYTETEDLSDLKTRQDLSGIYDIYEKNNNKDTVSIAKCESGNMSTKEYTNKLETQKYLNSISTRKISKSNISTTKSKDYNYGRANSISEKKLSECISSSDKASFKLPVEKTKIDMSSLDKGNNPNSAINDDSKTNYHSTVNVKEKCIRDELTAKILFITNSKTGESTTMKTKQDPYSSHEKYDDKYNVSMKNCQNGNTTTKTYINKAKTEKCPSSFTTNNISKENINRSERFGDSNEICISSKNLTKCLSAIKENFIGTSTGKDLQGTETDITLSNSKGSTDQLQSNTNIKEEWVRHKSRTQPFSGCDEMKENLNAVSICKFSRRINTYGETKNSMTTIKCSISATKNTNGSCCTRKPVSSTNSEVQDYGCAQIFNVCKRGISINQFDVKRELEEKKDMHDKVVYNRVHGIKSIPFERQRYSISLDRFTQVLSKTDTKKNPSVIINEVNILQDEFSRRVNNNRQERDVNQYIQTQTDQVDRDFNESIQECINQYEKIQILMTLSQSDKYTQIEIKVPESNKIQKSRHLVDKSIGICPLNDEKCTLTDTTITKSQSFNIIENTLKNKILSSYKITGTSVQTKKKENFTKSTYFKITPNVSKKTSPIPSNTTQHRSRCSDMRPKLTINVSSSTQARSSYNNIISKPTAKETSVKYEPLWHRKQAIKSKLASKLSPENTATAGQAFCRKQKVAARDPHRSRTRVKVASNQTSGNYVPRCCRTKTKVVPKPRPEIIEGISSCCRNRCKINKNNAPYCRHNKDIHIAVMGDHPMKFVKHDHDVVNQLNEKTFISKDKINSNNTSASTITSIKCIQSRSTASLDGNRVQMFWLKSSFNKLFNGKGRKQNTEYNQAGLTKDKGTVDLMISAGSAVCVRDAGGATSAAVRLLQPGRHLLLRHFYSNKSSCRGLLK